MDQNISHHISAGTLDPNDFSVRLATLGDYEAILDIHRELYHNMDYIPGMYSKFHKDPSHIHLVVLYKRKIIAYKGCMLMVPNTNCFAAMAARTDKDFQHLGIDRAINEVIPGYIKQHFKLRDYYMRIGIRDASKLSFPLFARESLTHLAQGNINVYTKVQSKAIVERISNLKSNIDTSVIQELSLENTISTITSGKHLNNLLSYGNYIIVYFYLVSMNLSKKTLPLLCKRFNTFISFNEVNLCDGVSFLALCPLLDGAYRFDIYYHGNPDLCVWAAHVIKQLIQVSTTMKTCKELRCIIHYPVQLDQERATHFLSEIFGAPLSVTKTFSFEACDEKIPQNYIKHKL